MKHINILLAGNKKFDLVLHWIQDVGKMRKDFDFFSFRNIVGSRKSEINQGEENRYKIFQLEAIKNHHNSFISKSSIKIIDFVCFSFYYSSFL